MTVKKSNIQIVPRFSLYWYASYSLNGLSYICATFIHLPPHCQKFYWYKEPEPRTEWVTSLRGCCWWAKDKLKEMKWHCCVLVALYQHARYKLVEFCKSYEPHVLSVFKNGLCHSCYIAIYILHLLKKIFNVSEHEFCSSWNIMWISIFSKY